MKKVKIFETSTASSAEERINKWIKDNPMSDIIDIKIGCDGHTIYTKYMIIYE